MKLVAPYVFRTRPHLCTKVWGGRKLETLFGKPLPPEVPIGESWEASDLPEGQSRIDHGPLDGSTLGEAVERWGVELIGTRAPKTGFPLLVKLLDACDDLSIQVHPGESDLAALEPGARSKDECWLILSADPGAAIIHGFNETCSAAKLARAIADGEAAGLLRRVEVQPGDVIRVAPGTIHAICRGVVLLEIQQPSDTTYRVYDYQRPGLDGQPRELHLEQALAVTRFHTPDPAVLIREEPHDEHGYLHTLIDTAAYRVELMTPRQKVRWSVDPGSVQIINVLEGACEIATAGAQEPLRLVRGQTAIVPACIGELELWPDGALQVVVSGLGGHPLCQHLS